MSSFAVAKLSGHTLVTPGVEANIAHLDETRSALYYQIRPQGEGLDEWFETFQAEQRRDGAADANRYYEILPRDAITKFSVRIVSGAQDDAFVRAACGYVAHKLLQRHSYDTSDISYWYRLDGHIYGVWPMIAMTYLDRQAAADLLDSGPQEQHAPFNRSWLDHYRVDNNKRIEFPLPAAGAQWIGVYDHEGIAKRYVASRHGRRLGHLVVNGGFVANEDPNINALQIATVYKALRIGLLTNLLITRDRKQAPKDPGYNEVFVTRRLRIRESARLRQQAPAHTAERQRRKLDRMNFLSALDVFGSDAVEVLQTCQARDGAESEEDAAIPEYYHTFNQMNKWFLLETKMNLLWHKTYDQTRYMDDTDRPERYLTIENITPQMVRQRLDRIRIMVENPGKPPKYINVYDAWVSHPQCNAVTSVVTCPLPSEEPLINPYHLPQLFNRWRHWDFYSHGHYDKFDERLRAVPLAQLMQIDEIKTVNAFVFGMLCNQDFDCFRIITLILANVLQRPDSRPEKAVFLKGPEGVGKSLFSKALVTRVFGLTHSAEFDRTEYILGHFNEAASGKAFVALEEALIADRQAIGRFQQLVTGELASVNGKFKNLRTEKNIATFWGNTNFDVPFAVNSNGRRYVITEVSPLVEFLNAKQKTGFFDRIASILDSDRVFSYAYFLSRIPLEEWFKLRKGTVVENVELGKMKLMSMQTSKPVPSWLIGCAQAHTFGRKEGADKDVVWGEGVPILDLYELFLKTRKFPLALSVFTHELMLTLGRVKGFNPKYPVDPRIAADRGCANAAWVYLPSYEDALVQLQSRIAGSEDVGSAEAIDRQLGHEAKLIKLSEAPDITATQLLPPFTVYDDAVKTNESLFEALFGAVDKVVVPCQKE